MHYVVSFILTVFGCVKETPYQKNAFHQENSSINPVKTHWGNAVPDAHVKNSLGIEEKMMIVQDFSRSLGKLSGNRGNCEDSAGVFHIPTMPAATRYMRKENDHENTKGNRGRVNKIKTMALFTIDYRFLE